MPPAESDDGSGTRCPVQLDFSGEPGKGVLFKENNLSVLAEESLDILLEAKADVNLGNYIMGESRSVLHDAAHKIDAGLMKKILSYSANVNQHDTKLGFSPLHLAARSKKAGSHEVIAILVDARADIGQVASNGKTARELAQVNGASEATMALLRSDVGPAQSKQAEPVAVTTLKDLTPEQQSALFLY